MLNNGIDFIAEYFFIVAVMFVVSLSFTPHEAHASIDVDGRLDESEWADAQKFSKFVVVDPLTMEKPGLETEALVLSTPEGLAIGFICEQPGDENRTRTITKRDATSFDADSVSFMIDFNDDGEMAYEFSVSISDSYRDGTITHENEFTYDWDGVWKHAVNEEQDQWTVEILLPWSIATMKGGSGEKRRIGICFQRQLQSTNEKYAFPAVSSDRPLFVSEFSRIEIEKYSSQDLEVKPYATALGDLLDDKTSGKAGLDILWKPNQKIHLLATVNPDFGYVESDDLVIDFSAYEVMYTEKRPFFTEDQSVFDCKFGLENIFYTRRIGAASDKDGEASDIETAFKMVGSTGAINFGVFGAEEADDAGRSFYAGRLVYLKKNWSVGALSTYVERPFQDRTALVNNLDYELSLGNSMRWGGRLIWSRIKTGEDNSKGFGLFNQLEYSIEDRWFFDVRVQHFDDSIDFNDMGFMRRNNIVVRNMTVKYNQTDFSEDSRTALVSWEFCTNINENTEGVRFPISSSFSRNEKMRSGSSLDAKISFDTNGYDDMISRSNGDVWLNKRWDGSLSYTTQRRGMWSKSISVEIFQEGYEDWAAGITSDITWYPNEKLNVNFSLNPEWSGDWLKWIDGKQLGSFSKDQVTATIGVYYFPAEDHEIQLRTQWYTVNAEAEQSYNIGDNGRLIADNALIKDFAATSFALQLRYRYEIAPMSDLYICYSRGGEDYIEGPEKGTLGLLGDSTTLRDSDQIMVKLSYRFKLI